VSGTRHLGLDLGATNLKWVVMERDASGAWSVIDRGQVRTQVDGGPHSIVTQLGEVGRAAVADRPAISTAGVGIPGVYDPRTGAISFVTNIPGGWDGQRLTASLSEALGVPVALINDARAFGVAELALGAGRGASTIVGLTLGTGVGGVIAVDGQVHMGRDGSAGEIGHQTIDPDGPECTCGNRGCLEAFVRADRIAAECQTATPEDAVQRAANGDTVAIEGLRRIGTYLGIGIANMIVALAPERVGIGGGVIGGGDLLLAAARAEIRRRVRIASVDEVEIVTAELGTWGGAIGAAIHGAEADRDTHQQPAATWRLPAYPAHVER
jgi:glucokinase